MPRVVIEDGDGAPIESEFIKSDSEDEILVVAPHAQSVHPIPTIRVDPQHTGIMCIDASKDQPLIMAGLVDGAVQMFKYDSMESVKICAFDHHQSGCRSVRFSKDGKSCFTASSDKSISVLDVNAEKMIFKLDKAHE